MGRQKPSFPSFRRVDIRRVYIRRPCILRDDRTWGHLLLAYIVMFVYTNASHFRHCCGCSCIRTYTLRPQNYEICANFFSSLMRMSCTHICPLQVPHRIGLLCNTVHLIHHSKRGWSWNAIFGCFQGRPINYGNEPVHCAVYVLVQPFLQYI